MPPIPMGLHPDSTPRNFSARAAPLEIIKGALQDGTRGHADTPMKTIRFVSTPTRSRRLNEILGLVLLATAVLLLLALASYTPSDPSFNTVGGYATGRPAHNWTGMVGAGFA